MNYINYRGSTAIPALAGCLLRIKKVGETTVDIEGIKNRDGKDQTLSVELTFGENKVEYRLGLPPEARKQIAKAAKEEADNFRMNEIREMKGRGLKQADIAEQLGISSARVSQLLRKGKQLN